MVFFHYSDDRLRMDGGQAFKRKNARIRACIHWSFELQIGPDGRVRDASAACIQLKKLAQELKISDLIAPFCKCIAPLFS